MEPFSLVFLILMMVVFYFMLIRPQKRRADQHRNLIRSLEVGDDVVTIGGLYGTVRHLGDDDVELEVSPGTRLRFVKTAVARRVSDEATDRAEPDDRAQASDEESA